ncbi:MAG: molybdenum cofactor guanylyltransferase MobA [Burkholderiales bacterium]
MLAGRVPRADITGLVLAGGAGQRMGGQDKGLLPYQGRPLVAHAIERLQPQVGTLLISANRHLADYAGFGWPLVQDGVNEPDIPSRRAGPLAGLLAGLEACTTPWLLSVPCDCPRFPLDLAQRLGQALVEADAALAIAATPATAQARAGRHPVFCLLHTRLREPLAAYLAAGGRRLEGWCVDEQRGAVVEFADTAAFDNLNTPADLAR